MRIRGREKLNLIDNYIAIYRILYNCKQLLVMNTLATEEMSAIQKICDQTLDLKSKYEEAFSRLKMIDESFLLLKSELNRCKGYPDKEIEVCSICELHQSLEIIERDYSRLQL